MLEVIVGYAQTEFPLSSDIYSDSQNSRDLFDLAIVVEILFICLLTLPFFFRFLTRFPFFLLFKGHHGLVAYSISQPYQNSPLAKKRGSKLNFRF